MDYIMIDVYRIVRLLLSYTFANLHTLILFLFGWNGSRLHESHVYSDVHMDEDETRPGHMSKYGIVPPLPEWIDPDDETEIYFWGVQYPDTALYKVVPQQRQRPSSRRFGYNDYRYITKVQDQELTLGQVSWGGDTTLATGNVPIRGSGSSMSMSWVVHITCTSGDPFYLVDPPSNMPIIMDARGAPPIEDAFDVFGELEADEKTIMPLLFSEDSFRLYCEGVLDTRARKECLAVFKVGEERGSDDDDSEEEDKEDVDMK